MLKIPTVTENPCLEKTAFTPVPKVITKNHSIVALQCYLIAFHHKYWRAFQLHDLEKMANSEDIVLFLSDAINAGLIKVVEYKKNIFIIPNPETIIQNISAA